MENRGGRLVSPATLFSEVHYGDPGSYSFAHGGKDGYPFPVDRKTYDKSIELLGKAVRKAKIGEPERLKALRRLSQFEA